MLELQELFRKRMAVLGPAAHLDRLFKAGSDKLRTVISPDIFTSLHRQSAPEGLIFHQPLDGAGELSRRISYQDVLPVAKGEALDPEGSGNNRGAGCERLENLPFSASAES
jgi:hypothetical protein